MENKTGKYFKYALGEIILVVIGILIALWINNINIEHQQDKERLVLITNLKQELNENLDQFDTRTNLLMDTNKNLIKVLNFSANSNTNEPIDSLRAYVTDALIIEVAILNNSRLSSAKSSGKFNLLSENITTALSDYETSVTNYLQFINATNTYFKEDWSELVIKFNSLDTYHNMSYPETNLDSHPKFIMSDEVLAKYLKEPHTYKLLHDHYTKFMIEKLWLKELRSRIEFSLITLKK